MNYTRSIFIIILFTLLSQVHAQEQPRYIFINTWTKWSTGRPASFNRKIIDEITRKVDAPKNGRLQLGISYVFDYLRSDLDSVKKSLTNFLKLSRETNIPVLVSLDGLNWMEGRPDL